MPIAVMAAAITNNPPADAIQDVLAVAWLRELQPPVQHCPTTKLPSIKKIINKFLRRKFLVEQNGRRIRKRGLPCGMERQKKKD